MLSPPTVAMPLGQAHEQFFQLGERGGWPISGSSNWAFEAVTQAGSDGFETSAIQRPRDRSQLGDDVFAATSLFDYRDDSAELTLRSA